MSSSLADPVACGVAEASAQPSPMVPVVARVRDYQQENADTFTLVLDTPPQTAGLGTLRPGQFNMLYMFGVGEVPISTSGDPAEHGVIFHTIRAVGTVTRKLAELRGGDYLGLRGPFGSSWPVDEARGRDVVIVTGGIGLAPLRPAIYHVLRHRQNYGRVTLLYGARTRPPIGFTPWSWKPGAGAAMCRCSLRWTAPIGIGPAMSGS